MKYTNIIAPIYHRGFVYGYWGEPVRLVRRKIEHYDLIIRLCDIGEKIYRNPLYLGMNPSKTATLIADLIFSLNNLSSDYPSNKRLEEIMPNKIDLLIKSLNRLKEIPVGLVEQLEEIKSITGVLFATSK